MIVWRRGREGVGDDNFVGEVLRQMDIKNMEAWCRKRRGGGATDGGGE